jgi:tetratricopeptide (TPR) repeat protein
MARFIVQFPEDVAVVVDGTPAGRTNRVISVPAGERVIRLEGAETEPAERTVLAPEGDAIVHVRFLPRAESIDRFSPLYCAYNGLLLGQFVSLSFAEYGRAEYPVRRARMLEFMKEAGIAADVPEEPFGLGSPEQVQLLDQVARQAMGLSKTLGDFLLLGTNLVHYGVLAESDPTTARENLAAVEGIRAEHGLPGIEPSRFVIGEDRAVETVLSPSLAYLAEVVEALDVEPETAFVIMSFSAPYAEYFSTFYRPALENAGMRAFRAWGGLGSEDYAVLLLALIAKSGMAWADVSEPNANVFYEIGAAHAFGKVSMLVVREDRSDTAPANIGHDAVARYSDTDDGWPETSVLAMGTWILALRAAAEAGERLRVTPDAFSTAIDDMGRRLTAILTPPEAQDAADDGQEKLAAGDASGAALAFDEAIALGLSDGPTLLGRGMSRHALERYAAAEEDLGAALADPGAAAELGSTSPDVFLGSARIRVGRGETDAARAAISRAGELGADPAGVVAAEGDVLCVEGRFDEAVAAYDRSLAQTANATVEFDRALALLLGGRSDEAIAGYRRGDAIADGDDRRYALAALDRSAAGGPATEECRRVLRQESP